MTDHLSTQERNPGAAVRRTLVAIVALIPIINGIAAITLELLNPYIPVLPAWVFPALNGVLVVTALLAAWVTRVMAMTKVNDWLRTHLPRFAPEGKTDA